MLLFLYSKLYLRPVSMASKKISRRGTSETHALHYKDCVYYTAYGGRRIDLFYTPPADALLLVPGDAFKRTSKLKNNEQ